MRYPGIARAILLSSALLLSHQALAGSAQATIAATFTQTQDCVFGSGGASWTQPMVISGSVLQQPLTGQRSGPSAVRLGCTAGTPWQLGISPGTAAGSSDAKRLMVSQTSGATLEVKFFQDAARTVPWGNTPGANVMSGVGTPSPAPAIYYSIPNQPSAAPDTYNGSFDFVVTY